MLGRGGEDEDEEEGAGRKKGAPMRDVKREEGGPYGLMGVILGLVLVNGKVLGDGESFFTGSTQLRAQLSTLDALGALFCSLITSPYRSRPAHHPLAPSLARPL